MKIKYYKLSGDKLVACKQRSGKTFSHPVSSKEVIITIREDGSVYATSLPEDMSLIIQDNRKRG